MVNDLNTVHLVTEGKVIAAAVLVIGAIGTAKYGFWIPSIIFCVAACTILGGC